MIVITGATGKLGRHVVEQLLAKVPAKDIALAVRTPDKAKDFAAKGVQVRKADYDDVASLEAAFAGADTLLVISTSAVGDQRVAEHTNIIAAAAKARPKLLAYTSILHADSAQHSLAHQHLRTEGEIRATGIPFVFLRNGWYLENYTENLGSALAHGALLGAAKDGKIAAAARVDFAAAAVAVLTTPGHANKIYELAGDVAFSMPELAAEVARLSGKPVAYKDLPFEAYRDTLASFGLPAPFAEILADSDVGIARGELDDHSGDLRKLIGRPTTTLTAAISAALG